MSKPKQGTPERGAWTQARTEKFRATMAAKKAAKASQPAPDPQMFPLALIPDRPVSKPKGDKAVKLSPSADKVAVLMEALKFLNKLADKL